MARPRSVDPQDVVDAVAGGMKAIDAAAKFGITRVRVSQILAEHAPHLRSGRGDGGDSAPPEVAKAQRVLDEALARKARQEANLERARTRLRELDENKPRLLMRAKERVGEIRAELEVTKVEITELRQGVREAQDATKKAVSGAVRERARVLYETEDALRRSKSLAEAARMLNISSGGLYKRIERFQINLDSVREKANRRATKAHDELRAATLRALKSTRTLAQAGERLGITEGAVLLRLRRMGLENPQTVRRTQTPTRRRAAKSLQA